MNLSEQELLRREKLIELKRIGINPYPAELFPVSHTSTDAREKYTNNVEDESIKNVKIAGRIMSVRDMGKACFAVIQDSVARIQVYVRRDDICPMTIKPCTMWFLKNYWILAIL